jgi:hypothetical protein
LGDYKSAFNDIYKSNTLEPKNKDTEKEYKFLKTKIKNLTSDENEIQEKIDLDNKKRQTEELLIKESERESKKSEVIEN